MHLFLICLSIISLFLSLSLSPLICLIIPLTWLFFHLICFSFYSIHYIYFFVLLRLRKTINFFFPFLSCYKSSYSLLSFLYLFHFITYFFNLLLFFITLRLSLDSLFFFFIYVFSFHSFSLHDVYLHACSLYPFPPFLYPPFPPSASPGFS